MTSSLSDLLSLIGSGELRITLMVCAASFAAVCVPLGRGAQLCWRARVATRSSLRDGANATGAVALLARSVADSVISNQDRDTPKPFVRDAARQLVVNDYEASFAQPISMYANLLPPIGFIGTTFGLAVLLLSMRISNDALQMSALALALSSTIFALLGYALLEGMKIHLYHRLNTSIDTALQASDEAAQVMPA
jgi:hypothetical protein